MPPGVLFLDVDDYDAKNGWTTWADHIDLYGAPPATWQLTSRTDGRSGQRMFQADLPDLLRAELEGEHVDLIHRGHRYILPSARA